MIQESHVRQPKWPSADGECVGAPRAESPAPQIDITTVKAGRTKQETAAALRDKLLRRARIIDVLVAPTPQTPTKPNSRKKKSKDAACGMPPGARAKDDGAEAVDLLLKLISQEPLGPSHISLAQCLEPPCAVLPEKDATAQHELSAVEKRAFYELGYCETLSDVARKFYGNADIAQLIYKLNTANIQAEFQRGLKVRLRMVPGTVLELPTTAEADRFTADHQSAPRPRMLEYDVI